MEESGRLQSMKSRKSQTSRSGGSGRDAKSAGCRAQSPRFWEGSWLLSAQESAGPVGSQEDVRGDGEWPYPRILNGLLQGTPASFVCRCPTGRRSRAVLRILSPDGRGPSVRKELRSAGTMCGPWRESLLQRGALDH